MCGRYAAARDRQELLEAFGVERDESGGGLAPDYNVAPTKPVYAVFDRQPRDQVSDEAGEPEAQRQLRVLRWGLVPSWAKDVTIGNKLINARLETVDSKPSFRRAFARRRCLLPADGYYEWYAGTGGTAQQSSKRPPKQPFFIRPADGSVLAMAGLYEVWRDPSRTDDDPHAWLWSCTVITTAARDGLGQIHDRMPMIVDRDRRAEWLDPSRTDAAELTALLDPASADELEAYPVSRAVNNVRNNDPTLIQPLPETDVTGDDSIALF